MNIRTDVRMDKAQFFAWLDGQERRHELADGRVTMLPFVTRNHWRITTNILIALGARLDRARFDFGPGDFAVETGERSVRFADVMVEPAGGTGDVRSTKRALCLVEVLSPSTMHVDFGEKLDEYRALPELGAYVIVAQDEARAWVWTRIDGKWSDSATVVEGLDGVVDVPVLGASVPLAEIYQGVTLR